MKKREAEFGTVFRSWLKANPMHSGAFELKQTNGNALPFSAVKDHQIEALEAVTHSKTGLLYKIPDDAMGVKPFDYVLLRNAPAYIVIKFAKEFHIISIDTFTLERQRSLQKSLTNARAREISIGSVKL